MLATRGEVQVGLGLEVLAQRRQVLGQTPLARTPAALVRRQAFARLVGCHVAAHAHRRKPVDLPGSHPAPALNHHGGDRPLTQIFADRFHPQTYHSSFFLKTAVVSSYPV